MQFETRDQAEKALAEHFPNGVPVNLAVKPIERVYAVVEREQLPVVPDVHEFYRTDELGRVEYDTAEAARDALQEEYPEGVPPSVNVEAVEPTSTEQRQHMRALRDAPLQRWTDEGLEQGKSSAEPPLVFLEDIEPPDQEPEL